LKPKLKAECRAREGVADYAVVLYFTKSVKKIKCFFYFLKYKYVVFSAFLSKYGFRIGVLGLFFLTVPSLFTIFLLNLFSHKKKTVENTDISKCFKVRQHALLVCTARDLDA